MTDNQPLFPLELLDASPKQRLAYYNDYIMAHPFLDDAFERLKPIIRESGESRVLFIVGPTGVGKTKLIELIRQWVIQELLSELERDRGRIPFALVEAKLPKSGLFNIKDHLKRSLLALHEPQKLIDSKIDYGVSGVYVNELNQLVVRPKILETDLGWALEQALKQRRPMIFCIDEAHHMLSVASGRKLTDVPEAIKSLANITQILHGLVGTYELLTLQDLGDQLSRRSVYIHLPRYNAKYREDREVWQSIVWNFQGHVPIAEIPDFLGIWDYLYERSLGCVGILKNWTRNALADALHDSARTVTRQHLEARALSASQALNILRKIKEGEQKYADWELDTELLRTELNLGLEPQSRPKEPHVSETKRKTAVGMRKPKRDPIGVQGNVEA
jgi:hypothetical protein